MDLRLGPGNHICQYTHLSCCGTIPPLVILLYIRNLVPNQPVVARLSSSWYWRVYRRISWSIREYCSAVSGGISMTSFVCGVYHIRWLLSICLFVWVSGSAAGHRQPATLSAPFTLRKCTSYRSTCRKPRTANRFVSPSLSPSSYLVDSVSHYSAVCRLL